jgi:hypothetical protein
MYSKAKKEKPMLKEDGKRQQILKVELLWALLLRLLWRIR